MTKRTFLSLLSAVALLPLAGCDLTVTDPDIITPDNLTGASALPTIRGAALGDFALSYAGSGADGSSGTEGIITMSGLLGDELINSETFPTRIEVDRRSTQVTNGTVTGWFRTLSRARRSVEFAADRFRALSDTTTNTGLSEMTSLAGYAYLWFAENWCSGVPFSTANPDGSLVFGQPLTTAQMFDTAAARFTVALNAANALIPTAGGRANMINLAKVGLARAQLGRGNIAGAASTVAGVPTSFNYQVSYSSTTIRENNGVFIAMANAKRYSVADLEGTNGLNWRGAADARIQWARAKKASGADDFGFDGTTPQFNQTRFFDNKTSVPLATGTEARLIEAESFLQAGDTTNFRATHDTLRAHPPTYLNSNDPTIPAVAPLGPLPRFDTLTVAGRQNLHFKERDFWLWLSAHRLGDLRRLARAPYSRAPESVFPTGAYFKGGLYGTDYNFPVPFDETNNPNFTQCLDRNP
jgi:hypothetical protein